MGFAQPHLLLLAIPAALAWWAWRGPTRAGAVVRAVVAALLVLACAGPYLRTAQPGRDLVVVFDRSRSMPADGEARLAEALELARRAARNGDRIALVTFGAEPALEVAPSADLRWAGVFARAVDRDGSNLGSALELALAVLPAQRPGSILLVSDGESNGRDPIAAARAAFARGVRIDVQPLALLLGSDVAVESLDAPLQAGQLEPFAVHAWVRSDRARELEYVLERDGEVLARGSRAVDPGVQRWTFRDLVKKPGVAQLRLRLLGAADARPENDTALTAVRIDGQRPVLIVNQDGAEDTLARALRQAAIPVEVVAPGSRRLERLALSGVRAVVLENVSAASLGGAALGALAEFVRERGGGLLMTGGRSSFGLGGYHRSTLDEVLPVSLEMRQESRKLGFALVIALDRSGSMAVEAAPGVPKMQLANLGACAAIELLSPIDSAGVLAIDSSDHVVLPLTNVDDPLPLLAKVRTIESMGGGIFCYTALRAAARMLDGATQRQRHMVLFADAADAEEQEGCDELIAKLARAGVTLSVVALGTEADSDAEFLKRCAAAGGGQCYFTTDAAELPRLFAQDTLTIARATFIDEPAACAPLPDLVGLGDARTLSGGFCSFDGYNVTWLRDGASGGAVIDNEYRSPAFAFWQHGLGRSAAFAGQIGGDFGASVIAWEGFSSFFVTLTRWLAGQEEPAEVFASARREGREALVRVEVDPHAATPPELSRMEVRLTAPDGVTRRLELERVGEHAFEARTTLDREGVSLGAVALGDGRSLALPPLTLPYSPEFEIGPDRDRGESLLRQVARESGGAVAPPLGEVFRGERGGRAWRVVSREFALAALLLMLLEIAARRLELWGSLSRALSRTAGGAKRVLTSRAPRTRAATVLERAPSDAPALSASAGAAPSAPATPPPSSPAPRAGAESLDETLARARRAAGRELDR
jgi:Mg-chelatase subunit ChlD